MQSKGIVKISINFSKANTKFCLSLHYNGESHEKCTTQPTLINLHPKEYTQGLRYYPFVVNLDRCFGNLKE